MPHSPDAGQNAGARTAARGTAQPGSAMERSEGDAMISVVPVESTNDILPAYGQTPVGVLLASHNLGHRFDAHESAALLIAMCMDFRQTLRIPPGFAYVIRTGGTVLRASAFHVGFAVAV